MSISRIAAIIFSCTMSGCSYTSSIHPPLNVPLTGKIQHSPLITQEMTSENDDILIALSFSGGGTRASAFSHGVLEELAEQTIEIHGRKKQLVDKVKIVSGVSGGAITAAYFGLHGNKGISSFRHNFLLRNAEENLHTSFLNPFNLIRILGGGANEATRFPEWLDKNLFHGATMGNLISSPHGRLILLSASDIYNRTPFVFIPLMFNSFCSDIRPYPLSYAVATSAAFPFAFRPIALKSFSTSCQQEATPLIERTLTNQNSPRNTMALAQSLKNYQKGMMPFIKLLDGGLTDNLGLHAFLISLLSARTPYEPLSQKDAVRLKSFFLFSIDATRRTVGDWNQNLKGPKAPQLLSAALQTPMVSNNRNSYDTLKAVLRQWQKGLIEYRCSLPNAEIRRLRGTLAGWDCKNFEIMMSKVDFTVFDQETQDFLDQIPTAFNLPEEQVDILIRSGRASLRENSIFKQISSQPLAASSR